MGKYIVTCIEDNKNFVTTNSFLKLKKSFKELKTQKGKIIHIIGSPGTGKSSNIYHAQQVLGLNMYNTRMALKNDKVSPKEVYDTFIHAIKEDLSVKTEDKACEEISKCDLVLFADYVLDSESLHRGKVGLGQWMRNNRLKSILFYFILIYEYLKHLKEFKKVNMVFHTTWTFIVNGKKYDLLTDFSLLSLILKSVLKLFFEVIEISYTESETIEIINNHFKNISLDKIKYYIDIYGNKPRLILKALEKDLDLE